MLHTKKLILWALIVSILASGAVFAAMHEDQDKQKDEQMMEKETQRQQMGMERQQEQMQGLMQANNIIGSEVSNKQGEQLGTITEIVIDPVQDEVAYAVITMDDKMVAIPWNEVQMQQDQVMLDISKDQLQKAESFDQDNWPNDAKQQWQQIKQGEQKMAGRQQEQQERMQQGQQQQQRQQQARDERQQQERMQQDQQQQARGQQEQFRMIKASEIMGLAVQNPQGDEIADIEDLCIDQKGKVQFSILSYGGFFGIDEKLVAVPWESLGFKAEPARVAVLDAEQETLDEFAFEEGQMPDLMDSQYTQRLQQQFGERSATQILGYMPSKEQDLTNEAWKKESDYNKNFKPDNVKSMQVTVKSVGTFHPSKQATEGLRLRVQDQQDNSHIVYAGPKAYAEDKKINIQQGDQIQLTGSQTEIGWREVVIATEITKNGKKLQLRNKQGQPQWDASKLDQMQKDKQQKQQQGRQRQQQMQERQRQQQQGR